MPNTSAQSTPPATVTTPPAAGDTQAPTVPEGVGAIANSSSSVTVSWTASTDNVGVTGYDIFRGGVKVKTVSGSTTSWTDTGLSANTSTPTPLTRSTPCPNTSRPHRHDAPGQRSRRSRRGTRRSGRADHHDHDGEQALQRHRRQLDAPYIQSLIANGTLYTNYQAAPGACPTTWRTPAG